MGGVVMGSDSRFAAFVSAYTGASNGEGADIDRRLGAALLCIQPHGRGTPESRRRAPDAMGAI